MKNGNSHFFDWHQFTKEFPDAPNKGIVFEDLVEELLKVMYRNEKWYRTALSYDGKKDFAYPDGSETPDLKWAECKNYKERLSLNVISPTLVMGAIDGIKSIIFFSYSELNENAVEGLLRYSQSTGTVIEIFDGLILESLIYRHRKVPSISQFFPTTDFERAFNEASNKNPQIIKLIRDANGNKIDSSYMFERGEPFYITLIIRNHINRAIDCEIEIFENKRIKCSKHLESNKVNFGENVFFSIRCEALLAGKTRVNCQITFSSLEATNTDNTFFDLNISDSQYLFWAGQEALDALHHALTHLKYMKPSPLLICAPPNTGKTTLLNILTQNNDIQSRYNILTVDIKKTRSYCFKEILARLFDINFNESTPVEQVDDEHKILSILSDEYVYSAKEIAEILMDKYQYECPYLVVVDNANKMSRSYEDLLYELDLLAEIHNKPVYYIYALADNAEEIDDFLVQINKDVLQTDNVDIVSLSGFNKNDIVTCLKLAFGLDNINDSFSTFEGKVSPIEFNRFSKRIIENEIIIKSDKSEKYHIVDRFLFDDESKKLLANAFSINNFLSETKDRERVEFILKYLYIAGNLSREKLKKYHRIMYKLTSYGIVILKGEYYYLAGDEVLEYIESNITISEDDYVDIYIDCFDIDVAKTICAIQSIDLIKDADQYLLSFFSNPCSVSWIYQKNLICRLIFDNFEKIKKHKLNDIALQYVKNIFEELYIEQGHTNFLGLMKYIVDSVMYVDWDTDENSVEIISFFMKKFLDRCLSTHNNSYCLDYYDKIIPITSELRSIADNRKFYWMSHYSNRAAIALDRDNRATPAQVEEMYKLSRDYCEAAGNPADLCLQVTIDEFYRHYVYNHDLDNTVLLKTKHALDQFGDTEIHSKTLPIFHSLLIEYLQNHMENSSFATKDKIKDFVDRVATERRNSVSTFFIIKLYLLEVYARMDMQDYKTAMQLLCDVIRYTYKKEFRAYTYKTTYIKAHLLLFTSSAGLSDVEDTMYLALLQMKAYFKHNKNETLREPYLLKRLEQFQKENDISSELRSMTDGYDGNSYFSFKNIDFPII